MAYDWEHVEAIRAVQGAARERFNQEVVAGDSMAADIRKSPGARETGVRDLDSWDAKLFKLRTQLIDYIIEHGLVQGFNWDGNDYPIKGGKIVVTEEMVKMVTDRFGYFTEKETLAFVEKYLPEHYYVSDSQYVHTDNNYTTEEKKKLSGVEAGAQVNAILDVIFNGNTVLDPETKVATITITPEMVKEWYESNENTNAFTDEEKAKLAGIDTEALANKVEDVTLDGETVVKNKVAVLTAKKIKDSYESNPDTNAFTDADKTLVEQILPEIQKGVNQHEKRLDDLESSQTKQDKRLDALEAKEVTQDNEITEAKASISELGNEVNSIAGRVSTNETEIANLKKSQTSQDEDISQLQEDVNNINQKDTTQDAEIAQLKVDVASAGKVDDVQVDGISVVENKVAKIPKVYTEEEIQSYINASLGGYVPYQGATKALRLGTQALNFVDSSSGLEDYAGMNCRAVELGKKESSTSYKWLRAKSNYIAFSDGDPNDESGYEKTALIRAELTGEKPELKVFQTKTLVGEGEELANVSVALPIDQYHAATKGYVDSAVTNARKYYDDYAVIKLTKDTSITPGYHRLTWSGTNAQTRNAFLSGLPEGKVPKIVSVSLASEISNGLIPFPYILEQVSSGDDVALSIFNPGAENIAISSTEYIYITFVYKLGTPSPV